MKDQNTLEKKLTSFEKWDAAHSIFLESLLKPDNHLRSCAHNQQCYDELMEIRDYVVDMTRKMHNPRKYIEWLRNSKENLKFIDKSYNYVIISTHTTIELWLI